MKRLTVILLVLTAGAVSSQAQKITDLKKTQIPGTERMLYGAEITLPSQGVWQLKKSVIANGSTHLFLIAPDAVAIQSEGTRLAAVRREENINRGRHGVQLMVYACQAYARKNNGVGPALIEDLEERQAQTVERAKTRSPWSDEAFKDAAGPFYFMLPNVKFDFGDSHNRQSVPADRRAPLAVELRPFIDDGKHWVAYTDYSCERVPIDKTLIETHALSIRPMVSKEEELNNSKIPATYMYQLLATSSHVDPAGFKIVIVNPLTGQELTANWNAVADAHVDNELLVKLNQARAKVWLPYRMTQASEVMEAWALDLTPATERNELFRQNGRRGHSTSVMNVLGGRAAIQETLQMQLIAASSPNTARDIDIQTLEGVQVKSHPYAEMLGNHEGVRLPLAEVVPNDHFFVYVAKPQSILPMLEDGADFLSEFGASLTGSSIKYDLQDRYLARLGLNQKWLQTLLQSGAVLECALVTPDLFFIDGTEITVVARLKSLNLMAPLLVQIGVSDLVDGKLTELKSSEGESVFWMLKNELLILSTCRPEAETIAALIDSGGTGSLGRSAEFRYMLTKLPLNNNSRALAYFSDPLIRSLVSPPIKIAQLRRAAEKSTLQFLTGRALLAKMDGIEDISIPALKNLGYLKTGFDEVAYTLDDDLTAVSSVYGRLRNLSSIGTKPVTMISSNEAEAYKSYMKNYTRFWRQFFDPIAIRLDDTQEHGLEVTTFILPLVDSSIYNGLKEIVVSADDDVPMQTPRFEQEPVLKLSLNLKDEKWQEIAGGLDAFTTRYSGINGAILDDLGPAIHLAVHDADPVIAMGSGDILGAAGGNVMSLGGSGEMLAIPMVLSMLTRPCTLAVATRDTQRTLHHLRMAASGHEKMTRRNNDFDANLYQIRGKDSWMYALNVAGIVKIRVGLEVRDGFLFIQNIPWSKKSTVTGVEESQLCSVRLAIAPEACKLGLPGLYAAAAEHQSISAFSAASMLYPLVASGYADSTGAPDAHMQLFGYRPEHPDGGSWTWENGDLASTAYGHINQRELPEHKKGDDDFGLMKKIKKLSVETQFEADGLRTQVRWQIR